MRIIAGKWRGRSLQGPPDKNTRPTADRVREALFSMLISRLGSFEELRVLDGFAGTGALGLEALSRGAAHCSFVENDITTAKTLEINLKSLADPSQVKLLTTRVDALPRTSTPVDVVLLDPPYEEGLGPPALAHLAARGWLSPATLISLETSRKEPLELIGFETISVRDHGKARLTFLRLKP